MCSAQKMAGNKHGNKLYRMISKRPAAAISVTHRSQREAGVIIIPAANSSLEQKEQFTSGGSAARATENFKVQFTGGANKLRAHATSINHASNFIPLLQYRLSMNMQPHVLM
jgi:hypothetical protein